MADAGTIERLRQYLRELSPQARSLLVSEFERCLLRGDDIAGAELVLQQLRRILREQREGAPRVSQPARLFFAPLEPFLVEDAGDHKHAGRLARNSLELLWTWIRRDLLPEESAMFCAEVEEALAAGDQPKAASLPGALYGRVAAAIAASFAATDEDEKARRRLLAQIGTARAGEDAAILQHVLRGRDLLATLAGQLPLQIVNLADEPLYECKALIESTAAHDGDLFLYALLTVMDRLAAPWQIIRFGTKAAGSNVAARVAETRYGVAVTIVLTELERMVRELRHDLHAGGGMAVGALLKSIHDCVRGLRTEIAIPVDSNWGRALSSQRTLIAELLRFEIEETPGRVRRLLRARYEGDPRPAHALNPDDVAETFAMVEFACMCRHFAGELALNEITRRALSDLRQYLDSATRGLIESVRSAGPAERSFRQSQLDAACRLCGVAFGPDYAAELAKAAELAAAEPVALRA